MVGNQSFNLGSSKINYAWAGVDGALGAGGAAAAAGVAHETTPLVGAGVGGGMAGLTTATVCGAGDANDHWNC